MEQVIEIIARYGLETVCLALCINLLTAIIKLPVKKLAKRAKNRANITRFIVFLPILLGLGCSAIYVKFIAHGAFGKEFITLWLSSSSLSLTFYAVFEKLVPPKDKTETDAEIAASKEIIDTIQSTLSGESKNDEQTNSEEIAETSAESGATEKIVLRGKHEDKT